MAIGTPTSLGSNTSSGAGQTSIAVAGAVIPADTLVVVCVEMSAGTGDPGPTLAVSDGTTTYTIDRNVLRTEVRAAICSLYYTTGATKTITASGLSDNENWIDVFAISGADPASWQDTGNSAGSGVASPTNIVATTLANIAQNDEVSIVALSRFNGTAMTWPPSGYTSLLNGTDGVRGRGAAIAYKTPLTAGATESATFAQPTASDLVWAIQTYKGATGGGGGAVTPAIHPRRMPIGV